MLISQRKVKDQVAALSCCAMWGCGRVGCYAKSFGLDQLADFGFQIFCLNCKMTEQEEQGEKRRKRRFISRSRLFPSKTGKSLRIVSEKGLLNWSNGLLINLWTWGFRRNAGADCKPMLARNFFQIITVKVCWTKEQERERERLENQTTKKGNWK